LARPRTFLYRRERVLWSRSWLPIPLREDASESVYRLANFRRCLFKFLLPLNTERLLTAPTQAHKPAPLAIRDL